MEKPDLWMLLGLSVLATYLWRATGVYIGSKIDPNGEAFKLLACVAYGMLAGLISRIFIFPVGMLAETPFVDRGIALVFGYILFFALGRNLFAGTALAFIVFCGLTASRSYGLI